MKLANILLEALGKTVTIKGSGEDKEVEVIKGSKKEPNLALVMVSDKKGRGRFAIVVKKSGKKVSPLYHSKDIKGNDYREKNAAWGDSIYYKFESETDAKKEAEELKKIYPKFDFQVIEDIAEAMYSITHIPTGYAVIKSKIKSHLVSAFKEIEALGINFSNSKDTKEVTSFLKDEDLKNKFMEIYRKYHMRAK